ncbi:MAG: YgjV family protein, partial [Clostridia bacterium]|nr:YgjV family protein [Clostridia bacterium]
MSAEGWKIVGECIGLVAVAEGFFVFLSNRRERILIFKFISDFLWLLSQLCLGGYTGALLNFVAMGREVVFYNRDKRRFAKSVLWLYFFLAVTVASPLFSLISGREGWYAILP